MSNECIIENEVGEVGTLHVSNKRIHGTVCRDMMVGDRLRTEEVNINLPFHRIASINMTKFDNSYVRMKLKTFSIVVPLITGLMCICFILSDPYALNKPVPLFFLGSIFVSGAVISSMLGHQLNVLRFKMPKDSIRISLTIDGIDYYVPFELTERETAEAKYQMLKDAKGAYDCLVDA